MSWNEGTGGGTGLRERLLIPAEVAALFRVDPKTVTRWAASGRIESVQTPGRPARRQAALITGQRQAVTPHVDDLREQADNPSMRLARWVNRKSPAKPDAPARCAAAGAMCAIDAMLGLLHKIRGELFYEIRADDAEVHAAPRCPRLGRACQRGGHPVSAPEMDPELIALVAGTAEEIANENCGEGTCTGGDAQFWANMIPIVLQALATHAQIVPYCPDCNHQPRIDFTCECPCHESPETADTADEVQRAYLAGVEAATRVEGPGPIGVWVALTGEAICGACNTPVAEHGQWCGFYKGEEPKACPDCSHHPYVPFWCGCPCHEVKS